MKKSVCAKKQNTRCVTCNMHGKYCRSSRSSSIFMLSSHSKCVLHVQWQQQCAVSCGQSGPNNNAIMKSCWPFNKKHTVLVWHFTRVLFCIWHSWKPIQSKFSHPKFFPYPSNCFFREWFCKVCNWTTYKNLLNQKESPEKKIFVNPLNPLVCSCVGTAADSAGAVAGGSCSGGAAGGSWAAAVAGDAVVGSDVGVSLCF